MNLSSLLTLALLGLGAAHAAAAQDVGQHPAVFAPRQLPGINPDTFIVGHPASPRNRGGHANREHPAVAQGQDASRAIDSNRFLVQPPAAVRWTTGPQAATPMATSPTAAALAAVASPTR